MKKENIHQNYEHVTTKANIANADSPIAVLSIPAGRVYRMQDGIPLLLKLVKSDGAEISRDSDVFIAWQAPIGKTTYQAGRTMNYGIFRRISITDQENIETQARRLIEFDDEEIARAERGEVSLLSGLTSDYKVLLMLKSSDVVDWAQATCEFNFDMLVLTEDEFLAEQSATE